MKKLIERLLNSALPEKQDSMSQYAWEGWDAWVSVEEYMVSSD